MDTSGAATGTAGLPSGSTRTPSPRVAARGRTTSTAPGESVVCRARRWGLGLGSGGRCRQHDKSTLHSLVIDGLNMHSVQRR